MTIALRRFTGWVPWLLPVLGAALSPLFIDGGGHWLLQAVSGALVGLALALLLWQTKAVPPYSAWLGAAAAAAVCLSMFLLALFAWRSDLSTCIVILAVTLVLGWALTR